MASWLNCAHRNRQQYTDDELMHSICLFQPINLRIQWHFYCKESMSALWLCLVASSARQKK